MWELEEGRREDRRGGERVERRGGTTKDPKLRLNLAPGRLYFDTHWD